MEEKEREAIMRRGAVARCLAYRWQLRAEHPEGCLECGGLGYVPWEDGQAPCAEGCRPRRGRRIAAGDTCERENV